MNRPVQQKSPEQESPKLPFWPLALVYVLSIGTTSSGGEVRYTEFMGELRAGRLVEVEISDTRGTGVRLRR